MTSDRAAQRTYAEAERIRYWWQVERERLLSTLARVNPDLWLEPMGEGEWSCHELLAHRTFWEAWELEAYKEYVKGKPPELLEFPVEMLDTANQKAVERLRTHKPSALIGAIEDYRAESRELLKEVADRDLETCGQRRADSAGGGAGARSGASQAGGSVDRVGGRYCSARVTKE